MKTKKNKKDKSKKDKEIDVVRHKIMDKYKGLTENAKILLENKWILQLNHW